MSGNNVAVQQPSVTENTTRSGSIDRAKYPYCLPSYDPTALDGHAIEQWLKKDFCFGKTDCDIYEIEGGQATWKNNRDDAQMQEYLHVSATLSNPSRLWKNAC